MKDALLLSIFFIRYTTSHTTNIILRKTLELITFFFPLLALLLIQIRFSAYQSLPLTLCHFFMVMTDIFLLLIYWQRVWNPRDNDEEDFQDDGSENKLTQIRVKFCYNKEKMNWKKAYLFIICPPIHLVTYFWQIIKDIHKSRGIFTALEIWSLRLIFLISVMNFLIIIILETEYKKRLYDDHKIIFNHLFCISNMPIGRYLEYLLRSNNYEEYLQLLVNSYNQAAVDNVMCRTTLSVGWDGKLYDCDFNQMLEIPVNHGAPDHLDQFDIEKLAQRGIMIFNHCYGCTAGSGSSCQGALDE